MRCPTLASATASHQQRGSACPCRFAVKLGGSLLCFVLERAGVEHRLNHLQSPKQINKLLYHFCCVFVNVNMSQEMESLGSHKQGWCLTWRCSLTWCMAEWHVRTARATNCVSHGCGWNCNSGLPVSVYAFNHNICCMNLGAAVRRWPLGSTFAKGEGALFAAFAMPNYCNFSSSH